MGELIRLQNWQYREPWVKVTLQGFSVLPVFTDMVRNTVMEAGRLINNLIDMSKILHAQFQNFQDTNPPQLGMTVGVEDGSGVGQYFGRDLDLTGIHTWEDLRTSAVAWIISNSPQVVTQADIEAHPLLKPVGLDRSFANPSRTLNSGFQVSTTRDAQVNYSVDIATSVSLSGGAVGTVFLEYADDSGFTTNVKEVGRMVNGNTGTLVIGLTLNQTATATVGGIIPAAKYTRIRTANTTGTPTFTFRSAQEVLL